MRGEEGGGSGYRQVSLYQVTWGYILGVTSHSLHPTYRFTESAVQYIVTVDGIDL